MVKSRNIVLAAAGIVLYLVFFCSFTIHAVTFAFGGLEYIKFRISPREGVSVSSSRDASELTRTGRFSSLWPEIKDCEWTLKWKDHRKHFLELPAPSDYEEIMYGYVIVPPEESKRLLARYDWGELPPPDEKDPYYDDLDGYSSEHARHWHFVFRIAGLVPAFSQTDRTLQYSRELEQEMVSGKYRFGSGDIFFDADRNTFFFYLIKRN